MDQNKLTTEKTENEKPYPMDIKRVKYLVDNGTIELVHDIEGIEQDYTGKQCGHINNEIYLIDTDYLNEIYKHFFNLFVSDIQKPVNEHKIDFNNKLNLKLNDQNVRQKFIESFSEEINNQIIDLNNEDNIDNFLFKDLIDNFSLMRLIRINFPLYYHCFKFPEYSSVLSTPTLISNTPSYIRIVKYHAKIKFLDFLNEKYNNPLRVPDEVNLEILMNVSSQIKDRALTQRQVALIHYYLFKCDEGAAINLSNCDQIAKSNGNKSGKKLKNVFNTIKDSDTNRRNPTMDKKSDKPKIKDFEIVINYLSEKGHQKSLLLAESEYQAFKQKL
ncbi:hypothetical protein [uncultured Mucilaginibacter sp.]|uniref:hypothetical protein n=1 Tax=uncultured Mucilaginibacter sp. TaxID=797541 RepID=UPI0025F2307C|nr:hypothetical protein [uncultured Mucilaginibacter sp.]